jgi:hypothetical protein
MHTSNHGLQSAEQLPKRAAASFQLNMKAPIIDDSDKQTTGWHYNNINSNKSTTTTNSSNNSNQRHNYNGETTKLLNQQLHNVQFKPLTAKCAVQLPKRPTA